jgi:hypothetical protein
MNKATLEKYLDAKSNLTYYKALEKELRIEIAEELFPNAVEGTHNLLKGDYIIKGGFKLNYKIDQEMLAGYEDAFSEEEENCIRYKPELIMKDYKELDEDERTNLDNCLVITPGLPSIKITVAE